MDSPAPGTPVSVYGHGWTKEPDPSDLSSVMFSDVLQRGDMQTIDHQTCVDRAKGIVAIDDQSVLCADATAAQPSAAPCYATAEVL